MKRRTFVKSSVAACLTGAAVLSRDSAAADAEPHAREYYELRTYTLKDGKQPLLDDYLSKAFIPALGRLGIEAVYRFAPGHYSHVVMGANCLLVEIDRITGQPRVRKWVIAYDTGRVINPLLLTGQVRGAAAQGLGGSLYEEFVYDAQGQPLSTSFIDYALPTAAEVPEIEVELLELGSGQQPDQLDGAKGGGEGGIVGSGAAIANAVADALGGDSPVFNRLPLRASSLLGLIPEGS